MSNLLYIITAMAPIIIFMFIYFLVEDFQLLKILCVIILGPLMVFGLFKLVPREYKEMVKNTQAHNNKFDLKKQIKSDGLKKQSNVYVWIVPKVTDTAVGFVVWNKLPKACRKVVLTALAVKSNAGYVFKVVHDKPSEYSRAKRYSGKQDLSSVEIMSVSKINAWRNTC
jgi:hypothetical protein